MSKRDTSTQKMGNTAKNSSFGFKPLIASSLALALGVSVGMAQSIGSNTAGSANSDTCAGSGPCIYIDAPSQSTITLKAGADTTHNEVVWTNPGNLANNDQKSTITAKGIILKLGDNGQGTISAPGNRSSVTFNLTNSTLMGNISSTQNSGQPQWNFNGNGGYSENITINGASQSVAFALVGNAYGNNVSGVNPTFNFNSGANVKGKIYTKRNGTFNFNDGNIFVGQIGNGEGDTVVNFNGNATLKAGSNGRVIYGNAGQGTTIIRVNLAGASATNLIEGNIFTDDSGIDSGPVPTVTLSVTGSGSTTTFKGNMTANLNGNNTLDFQQGTNQVIGDLLADGSGYTTANVKNIIKTSNTATLDFQGNITSQSSPLAANYILGLGSGDVSVGKDDMSNTFSLAGAGGKDRAAIYVTDYDSKTNGFENKPTNAGSGTLTLKLASLSLQNGSGTYKNSVGQTVIIDWNSGSAVIDQLIIGNDYQAYYGGNTMIVRFRDSASGTSSIAINEGNIKTGANAGKTLLQAKTITLAGNVSSHSAGIAYLWGNQITVQGSTVEATDYGKTIFVADGTDAAIKANTISVDVGGEVHFMINQNANIATLAKTDNSSIAFSLAGNGGAGGAKIFITDYDSLNNGFVETTTSITPLTANASFTLNASGLSMSNYGTVNGKSKVGQSFILDYDQGSATINSGTENQSINVVHDGQEIVLRFRDNTADTSITLGGEGLNNGTIRTKGTQGNTLLQAKTIKVYGDIITENGNARIIGANANGTNSLTANSIQSSGGFQNSATTLVDFSQGGSITTGYLTAQKSDGGGDASPTLAINVDNSKSDTDQRVLISSISSDSTPDSLVMQGASIDNGAAVSGAGKTGNVALFNNTSGSVITLDVKSKTTSDAFIIGDIYSNKGTTNVRLTDTTSSGQKIAPTILGNIITNGGSTNIVLENAILAPANLEGSSIFEGLPGNEAPVLKKYIDTYHVGNLTTNGGTTTVVSRLNNAQLLSGMPLLFKVNNQSGETNLVMQINQGVNLNTIAQIDYSSGTVNTIFANSNDGQTGVVVDGTSSAGVDTPTESFGAENTDSSVNKFFGLTYQDGVKLTLQSQTVHYGNEAVDIVTRYGNQFRALNENGNLLTIQSSRDNTNHTDTITLTGLTVGEISSLTPSASGKDKLYITTLSESSAFVGSINLDDSTANATLAMKANTKLILTGDKVFIKTLTLEDQTTIDHNQLQLETLSQTNNRVINLATNGGSASSVATRSNFRLLEIGSSSNGTNTGLLGNADETIVFTTYVNPNAVQKTIVNNTQDAFVSQGATLGGEASYVEVTPASRASISNTQAGLGKYGYSYADRIIIHNVSANATSGTTQAKEAGSVYLQFAVDAKTNLGTVKYDSTLNNQNKGGTAVEGNIAVLTVKNSANGGADKALIKLETKDTLQGFDVLSGTVQGVATDANGMTNGTNQGDYTTYFITSLATTGADSAIQETISSAFATSLDIYAANFNSLNKRMGELRDNPHSQGVWARVFGGEQSSEFGLGSTTEYVTVQAGYDYAFGFEGANNYLGFALAYSNSSSKTSNATNTLNGASEGLDGDMKSNMIEVGIYNSYVQDEGWYNDSIFKFSYITNDFSTTGTAMGNSVSTTNYGIILSDEFGYRFKLGSEKEWYIDPQAEFSFGYVNGTEYTLSSGRSELQAKSDALMQLRARLGSSFGYDFKKFTQGKAIKASVYVGAFYEYDYLSGGDVTLSTNLGGINSIQSSLNSDGRVVMNIGTNMSIKDNTRIYFDFEKSFAGKITTDYQVNVGVRYSFGENTGYTPIDPNKKSITPLKVSDENAQESEEKANSEVKEENATEQNTQEQTSTDSKDNKTEESTEVKSEEKAQ